MESVQRARVAIPFLLLLAAGCGSEPHAAAVRSDVRAVTTTAVVASELHVTCTESATSVDVDKVEAGPRGVAVTVVDNTELDLRALVSNPTLRGGGGYVQGVGMVEVPPGRVFVRCVDYNTPEHSEEPQHSEESREVEVIAVDGVWRAPEPLSCPAEVMGSTRLRAEDPDEPDSAARPETPVAAVREDFDIAPLLDPGDELITAGYRDTNSQTVQVRRSGTTVLEAGVGRDAAGWYVGGFSACSPLPSPDTEGTVP